MFTCFTYMLPLVNFWGEDVGNVAPLKLRVSSDEAFSHIPVVELTPLKSELEKSTALKDEEFENMLLISVELEKSQLDIETVFTLEL